MLIRKALAGTFLAAITLVFVDIASASPPTRLSDTVDVAFKSNRWTSRCGFPVYIHQQGVVSALLFYSQDGSEVISEVDTTQGYTFTYFSPVSVGGTGGSYTAASADALRTTYPDGAELGAPAILDFNGLQVLLPGLPQAGRDAWLGEVAFITDEGQPLADLIAPVSTTGHFSDTAQIIASLCGALASP